MQIFILNAFGGLRLSYYLRQLFFSGLLTASLIFIMTRNDTPIPFTIVAFFVINCIFYPYARFVYECIVDFILGDNIIISYLPIALFFKLTMMMLCFSFTFIIAPIGMITLGFMGIRNHNTNKDNA